MQLYMYEYFFFLLPLVVAGRLFLGDSIEPLYIQPGLPA